MDQEAKAQKESDRLARVRENQRKSRARKQEYVRELEQRVAVVQQEIRQADVANRIVLQKLETENHLIMNLVVSLGISTASVKRFLDLADQNTVADRKVAIPAAKCISPCSTSLQVTTSASTEGKGSAGQPLFNDNVQLANTILTKESEEEQQECTTSTSCKKSSTEQLASEPQPDHQNTVNTTLCVVAEEFLDRHNAQGIDMDDLRRRICPGIEENALGCCRVKNDVIFQILDEISNEKLP